MEIPLLTELVVIFGLASIVLLICNRFRIPSIVGLLLTGILSGPHGLRFVQKVHEVEILSELGIVLLLFTIGLEFSLKQLMQSKKQVILGGALQVGLTLGIGALFSMLFGLNSAQSVFFGCAIALSSTAITLKFLQERGLISSSYGRLVVAILIFQDMAAVPMMLITPLLAGSGVDGESASVFLQLGIGLVLVACVFVGAQSIVPR
ncbi:MAG: cation:proton antiporter [Chlamydiia bacterium]|nr:cation:proton antiporter [Chlamydiia bacterium]